MKFPCHLIGLLCGLPFLAAMGCATPHQSMVDSLPTYHATKKIVAVLEFQNATDYGADQLTRLASDMFVTAMKRSERFLLVERERLNQVLEEQAPRKSGPLDPNTRARAGQVLGTQFIIMGTVTGFGFKEKEGSGADAVLESMASGSPGETRCRKMDTWAVIDVRAVEVKSGRIVCAEKAEGGDTVLSVCFRLGKDGASEGVLYDETVASKTLQRAVDRCVYDISMAMKEEPWEGRIAKVSSGKIFVVGGKDVGVPVNLEVEICRVEPGPKDPASGEILEVAEKVIGHGTVVRVEEHYSVVQIQEGGGFSFNDIVRLAKR